MSAPPVKEPPPSTPVLGWHSDDTACHDRDCRRMHALGAREPRPAPITPPVVLDQRYRDRITGISGIATAYTTFLYDTPSVRLSRLHNGKPDDIWLTAARLIPDDDPAPGTYA